MAIEEITLEELCSMSDQEGLVLQGCGGDLQEWVDGINEILTEEGILLDGCQFHNCKSFKNGEITCLLFPFDEDMNMDIGRFALWRLITYGNFAGTWLSDYIPNMLGGFIDEEEGEEYQDTIELDWQ